MKRILVGVDGSEISKAAVGFAAGLARATGAELQLACCVEPPLYAPDIPSTTPIGQAYKNAADRTRAMLADTAASPALKGLGVKTCLMEGAAADTLARLATGDIDLVVVGHRNRNAIARAMLGSVADRLAQICPRPLLVFR